MSQRRIVWGSRSSTGAGACTMTPVAPDLAEPLAGLLDSVRCHERLSKRQFWDQQTPTVASHQIALSVSRRRRSGPAWHSGGHNHIPNTNHNEAPRLLRRITRRPIVPDKARLRLTHFARRRSFQTGEFPRPATRSWETPFPIGTFICAGGAKLEKSNLRRESDSVVSVFLRYVAICH